jgi:hypothetical protein
MRGLIFNANSKTLDQMAMTLPDLQDALMGWFQNIVFTRIKKETVNFQVVETFTEIAFRGVVENVSPSNLDMKQEGQRRWEYISVWSTPDLELSIDDRFKYQNKNYRVLQKNDWSAYGYVQYECTEDYTK